MVSRTLTIDGISYVKRPWSCFNGEYGLQTTKPENLYIQHNGMVIDGGRQDPYFNVASITHELEPVLK